MEISNAWSPQADILYFVAYSYVGVNFYYIDWNQLNLDATYCLRKDNKADRGRGLNLGSHTIFFKENEKTHNEYKCLIVNNSAIFERHSTFNKVSIVFQSETNFRNVEFAYPSQ